MVAKTDVNGVLGNAPAAQPDHSVLAGLFKGIETKAPFNGGFCLRFAEHGLVSGFSAARTLLSPNRKPAQE